MSALDAFTRDYAGKKVLIFGLGLLGRGVGDALFFQQLGCQVRVTDKKDAHQLEASMQQLADVDIEYTLGKHEVKDIHWADSIVRNAAVPWHHPLLDEARRQEKAIVMDSQLFVKYADIPVIGITGTRGKTTTTMMIHHVLTQTTKRQIILGGNINHIATLPLLETIKPQQDPLAVLELSSWQLQAFGANNMSPHIGVVTNLYPDHLNMYPDLETYYNDKKTMVAYQSQTDHACLCREQPEFHQWKRSINSQLHWFDEADIPASIELAVPGIHNRRNAAAALAACLAVGIPRQEIITHLQTFQGVPYRIQLITTKRGVRIYNDTTSTTPTATITALNTMDTKPILIVGGTSKQLPLGDLPELIQAKTKAVIYLKGSGTSELITKLDQPPEQVYDSLESAVNAALDQAASGDVILFSPGFTSFGMWNNEFHRGQQFNQLIDSL